MDKLRLRDVPWHKELRYWFKRITNRVLLIPKQVKWFVQRGYRGWADCDIWSLDWYLAEWLPDALRSLKKNKHGTPIGMFPTDPEYINEDGNPTEEACRIASERWDNTMNKMIAAFEAWRRIGEMLYDDESFQESMKRDEKIFNEGAALFVEHFGSLWD